MIFTKTLLTLAVLASASAVNSLSVSSKATEGTIVDLALATPDLSTLVTALKAADLVTTLSSKGPFTVFAPTNEAFSRIPKDYLTYLLDPKNKGELVDLLTYHVAAGDVHSTDLKNNEKITTVEGQDVYVEIFDQNVHLNCLFRFCEAKVTAADNNASNGVVHIIDRIIVPPHHYHPTPAPGPAPNATIVELALATPDLSTLVTALKAADLVTTLSGKGPFTVFAPSNEAFSKLDKKTLDYLLDPKNIKELQAVLTYHVAAGEVLSKDLSNRERITTVEGSQVEAFLFDNKVYINDGRVEKADVLATNGVVHVIDHVLIPRH